MKLFAIGMLAFLAVVSASAQTPTKPKQNNQKSQQITIPGDINQLLSKHTCLACHAPDKRLVGPAYVEVAKKKYTNEKIVELIYKPQPANWPGYTAMIGLPNVPKEDALKIAAWINTLAKK